MSINETVLHRNLTEQMNRPYAFDSGRDLAEQKAAMEKKYRELLGMPEIAGAAIPEMEYAETADERFDEIRFHFESEPGMDVPAHMLLPKNRCPSEKLPVVICLQGHSTGMHISLGRAKCDRDQETLTGGDRDFALQIVEQGYIAVALEQRGMGEQSASAPWNTPGAMCHMSAMPALLLGRTLIGERAFDISRLIDALESFDRVQPGFDVSLDLNRIGLMGNSGGGTATYHTSCVEPRIKVTMPSCAFNTYADSIMAMHHCTCNFIPGIVKNMEMPDLAVMIAPRPLVIVSGVRDPIFPFPAVEKGYAEVQEIYKKAGAPDNCRLVVGDGEHRFYAADAWPVFRQFI